MGRGHSINLNSVLKPLLHAECRQACSPHRRRLPTPAGLAWSVTHERSNYFQSHHNSSNYSGLTTNAWPKKCDHFEYRAPQVHIISEWAGHQRCAGGAVDSSKASSETLMSPVCLCSALSEGLVLSHPGLGVCSTAGLWTVSYIPLFTC